VFESCFLFFVKREFLESLVEVLDTISGDTSFLVELSLLFFDGVVLEFGDLSDLFVVYFLGFLY
jgi:hypothetical protein